MDKAEISICLKSDTYMLEKELRSEIIGLVRREVVPAMGCTEPAAVSLAVAKATETLGTLPGRIRVGLSSNMLKNAMGVGIPGTGMIGLPIAVALGALIGKSEYGLEVLRDVNEESVKKGRRYIEEGRIEVYLVKDTPSNLHIDVEVEAEDHKARCVISRMHTEYVLIEKDGAILFSKEEAEGEDNAGESHHQDVELNLRMVWEFATESPVEELSFILEARDLNYAAAQHGFKGGFGHSLGSTIYNYGKIYFGDSTVEHMICATSAACDARMGGAPIPVMSNSGSGNQGITATMPVVIFAEDNNADEEHLVRALMLSHLTSIYIKQSLGRLSALCGCVVASTGAASGIVYLMGGGYEQVCASVKNMVANLAGMLCDGAKPSCSMKISSGVSTAMMSAMLAMNGKCATSTEGIVSDDVDQTIRNLTSIGREAMKVTDLYVLDIMTGKC